MSVTVISKEGGATITGSSIIPLTTVFTPPSDCRDGGASATTPWANDQYAIQIDSGFSTPSCYPSSYAEYQYTLGQWYSPGVCPHEYNYVATSIQSPDSGPATTFAVCCPSGLHSAPSTGFSCYQVAPDTTTFANPLSVAWQESDLTLFTPASAPVKALASQSIISLPPASSSSAVPGGSGTSTTKTSSGQAASRTNTSTPQTSSASHGSSGLSPGAAAGIGVGATIAVIAIIAGIWWFSRRYKLTKREQSNEPKQVGEHAGTAVYEKQGKSPRTSRLMAEAPDNALPYEADHENVRAELEGDWRGTEAGKGVRSPI